jgi:hypothetical protein
MGYSLRRQACQGTALVGYGVAESIRACPSSARVVGRNDELRLPVQEPERGIQHAPHVGAEGFLFEDARVALGSAGMPPLVPSHDPCIPPTQAAPLSLVCPMSIIRAPRA